MSIRFPLWTALVFAGMFWLIQFMLRRHIRTWALLCFPATVLHEFAHGLVGFILGAQPATFNLWPKRVSTTAWRLGYVSFTRLTRLRAGAVALAPLLWVWPLLYLPHGSIALPRSVSLEYSALIGAAIVWIGLAVAPSKSDWQLAAKNPLSALLFCALWGFVTYKLLAFRLVL
jgi:hypothetical protein